MKWISLNLMIICLGISSVAWGQTCSVTVSPVIFGGYDMTLPAPLDSTGTISVICGPGVVYSIKLDPGRNAESFIPREMGTSGSNSALVYNLYQDASFLRVWGDDTGGTFARRGIGTGVPEVLNVYGRIPSRQNVTAGVYSDSVTVIIEW